MTHDNFSRLLTLPVCAVGDRNFSGFKIFLREIPLIYFFIVRLNNFISSLLTVFDNSSRLDTKMKNVGHAQNQFGRFK